jgi:uncharacterized protein (DUF433 family)
LQAGGHRFDPGHVHQLLPDCKRLRKITSARTLRYSCTLRDIITFVEVIVKNPAILGGTPVFRGTRVPLQALFDYLEGGDTLEEFLDGYPSVSREMAIAALEEAKELLSARI